MFKFGTMLAVTFILSVFATTINGGNQYLQRKLTGAGSMFGQIDQYSAFGGYSPDIETIKLYTSPPLPKPVGYQKHIDNIYKPNDDDRYSNNQEHTHNHNHQHNHNHNLNNNQNSYPVSSNQQTEKIRNTNYPQDAPSNRNTDNLRDTTERYNRDTESVNNSNRRTVPTKVNTSNPQKVKDYDPNQMVYPTDPDISTIFGKHQQPQTPFIKPINPRSPPTNCTFGLCKDVDNYPTEKILKIVGRSRELQQYLTEMPVPDVGNRFGDNEDTLCPTMTHTEFPKSATNVNNEQRYLVNVGDYKQGISFETCLKEGEPCKFSDGFPNDYTTHCEQKYTIRRLMAVGKESDNAVFDNFHLPSCCVCVTKKN